MEQGNKKQQKKQKGKKKKNRICKTLVNILQSLIALLLFTLLVYVGAIFSQRLAEFSREKASKVIQNQLEEMKELVTINGERDVKSKLKKLKQILGAENQNICIGGVPPDSLSNKEYARAFAKGPCSPTVALPGITASKLLAVIDCEELREEDPKTFKACGWNTCNYWLSFIPFFSRPRDEYVAFIPYVAGPMNLIPITRNSKNCFIGLMSPKFNYTEGKPKFVKKAGVLITPVGKSPGSRPRKVGGCGKEAVDNIGPLPIDFHATSDYFNLLFKGYE